MTQSNRLKSLWAGHFFLFEKKLLPSYDSKTGVKLLLIFLILEYILGPRLTLPGSLGIPVPDAVFRLPLLLLLALVLIWFFAKLEFSQIGLYSWKHWSSTERWYFIQVIILANVIFTSIQSSSLKIISDHAMWTTAAGVLIINLLWGLYQELIYRGILQTELVRRWGAWTGILVSNLLFTFGPLHFYHFQNPAYVWMFAAIFGIGLFFSVLFHRSGNLWMVGIFHGIGDWYISGVQEVVGRIQ